MKSIFTLMLFFSCGLSLVFSQNDYLSSVALVAYWPFDGNAKDVGEHGLHGELHGATLTTDRFGNYQSAYYFNGIDNYIRVKDTALLNPNEMTICLWFKTSYFSGVGNNAIIDKGYFSHFDPYYQYHIGITGDHIPTVHKYTFGGDVSVNNSRVQSRTEGNFWTPDRWYFLCYTKDDSTARLYVNDSLVVENEAFGPIDAYGQDLFIGKIGNLDAYTPGVIDDIRIYNKALSYEHISSMYKEMVCGNIVLVDTIRYKVCDSAFESVSPRTYLVKVDSFKTELCGMDSIVYQYENYTFQPNFCPDTAIVHVYDTISVVDTLKINVSIAVPNQLVLDKQIKIYPNPTREYVTIEIPDVGLMSKSLIRIVDLKGQLLFESLLAEKEIKINLNDIGRQGIYLIQIMGINQQILTSRKLVLY